MKIYGQNIWEYIRTTKENMVTKSEALEATDKVRQETISLNKENYMPQAKIEICTRDIDLPAVFSRKILAKNSKLSDLYDSDPQHLFILFTKENGEKIIFRGGPEKEGLLGMVSTNIKAVVVPYILSNSDKFPNDFSANPVAKTIFTGTDVQMKIYLDRAVTYAKFINEGKYDYKLPYLGGSAQNSNTVIKLVTEFMELPLAIPKDPDSKYIWVPGINIKGLDHTATDYIFAEIKDRIESFKTPAIVDPEGQRSGERWEKNYNGQSFTKVTKVSDGKFLYMNPSNAQIFYEGVMNVNGQDIGQLAYYANAAQMSMAATDSIINNINAGHTGINNHAYQQNTYNNVYDSSSSVVTGNIGVGSNDNFVVTPLGELTVKELHWDSNGTPYYEYH